MTPAPFSSSSSSNLLRELTSRKLALFGLLSFLCILVIAILAPWISPQNPYDLSGLSILDSRLPPGAVTMDGTVHRLGTDEQGRDMLSAIFYGLRISLIVGISSCVLSLIIGTILGLVAGYYGGRTDAIIMRLVDLQLAIPAILIAFILLATLGRGVDKIIIALVSVQWVYFARTARSSTLVERSKEYIQAGRLLGFRDVRLIFRHILPNIMSPVSVVLTIEFAHAIALEATLSFLGVGLPVTEPSLGYLISSGFTYLLNGEYWISIYPGIALLVAVFSLNLLGDALRDVLNPRRRK